METKAFIDSSELHVVIPQSTRAGVEDLFTHNDSIETKPKSKSPLGIGERSLLHFGSLVWFKL